MLSTPGQAALVARVAHMLGERAADTEADADAGGFLECFDIVPERLPVVIAGHKCVLRNPSNAALADGRRSASLDWGGAALATVALGLLTWSPTEASAGDSIPASVWLGAVAGFAPRAGFV